jgi:branched-chain amino acid transport system ATP-binding protein
VTAPGGSSAPSDLPVLRVDGLSVGYGRDSVVLHDISIDVPQRSVVAVLGANGAGKTTLVRSITGLLTLHGGRLHGGTIRISGRDVTGSPPHRIVASGVAQVPEGRLVFPNLSVSDNLRVGGATCTRTQLNVRLGQVYDLFPVLRERRKQHVGLMSGGEQQMVAIGRALMAAPKLLVLDEVSLGLAPRAVQAIFERLAHARELLGTAMLVIEQNAPLAMELADYVYVLESGRVAISGSSEDMSRDRRVQEAYLGVSGTERRTDAAHVGSPRTASSDEGGASDDSAAP